MSLHVLFVLLNEFGKSDNMQDAQASYRLLVGRICNNFEMNRALYDKSMKLGTWLVDNKTKKNKGQCHAKNAL